MSWGQHPTRHWGQGIPGCGDAESHPPPARCRDGFYLHFCLCKHSTRRCLEAGGCHRGERRGGRRRCRSGAASPRAGRVSALPRFLPLIRALFGRGVPCARRKEEGERGAGSSPGEGRNSCVCWPGDRGSRAAADPAPDGFQTPRLRAGTGVLVETVQGQSRGQGLILLHRWPGSTAASGVPLGFPAPRDGCVPGVPAAGPSSAGDATTGCEDGGCLGPWGRTWPKQSVSLWVRAAMALGWDPGTWGPGSAPHRASPKEQGQLPTAGFPV